MKIEKMPKELESEVYIHESGTGYFVVVSDAVSHNRLAVTAGELRRIMIAAQEILNEGPEAQALAELEEKTK